MHASSPHRRSSWRIVLASLVVVSGSLVVSPSFDFDTDNDGVADSTEVYETNTDPATPDASFNPTHAETNGRG